MYIETTININKTIFEQVTNVSNLLKISKSQLFSYLLDEMIKHETKNYKSFSRVKYQKRSRKRNWKRLHVYFRCDVYEKALDLRKLLKCSVSFIIFLAFTKYLNNVIHNLTKQNDTDNDSSLYFFITDFDQKLNSYTIYYTMPEEIKLKGVTIKT